MAFIRRYIRHNQGDFNPTSFSNVGSLIWNDQGVLSNFGSATYATIVLGSYEKSDLVEVVISLKTGTSISANGVIGGTAFPNLQFYNSKANLGGSGAYGTYTYSTNEDVVWKIQIQNGTGKIYRKDSSGTFVLDYTFSYSTAISGTVNLGWFQSNRYLTGGTINLKDCYVKVNNNLVWTPLYTSDVEGYKTNSILHRYIKHAVGDYNPKNVLVIGSPTITEQGVASGFSTANYIRPTAFKPENNPWEMLFKVTTGEDVTTEQCIFGVEDLTNQRAGFGMSVHNGLFSIRLMTASSGTSWTFAGDGTIAVQPNTTYTLKANWDGNTYMLQIMEEGTPTYITDISYISSSPIYRISNENEDVIGVQMRSSATLNPFLGSIDLSESYMKVNDEYYWSGFYTENMIGYRTYSILRRNREYFRYSTWNQPILTSNTSYGTITASSDLDSDSSEPWQILTMEAVAGRRFLFTGTGDEWLQWKLPEPIKITSCTVYNSSETLYLNRFPKSINLQVSDDGSSWKTIGSASGYAQPGNSESLSFTCDSDKAYSYIRWQFAQTFGASPMAVGIIKINAKKVTGGTSSNYDFYKDSYKAY